MSKRRGRGEGSYEQLPSGSWRAKIEVTPPESEKREWLRETFGTKAEAIAWLSARKAEQVKGRLANPGRLTVGEYLEEWLRGIAGEVESSTHAYYRSPVNHLLAHLGSVPLAKLDARRVRRLYAEMAAAGLSTDQRRKAAGALRTALKVARKDGLLVGDPAGDVKMPRHRVRDIRPLTLEQVTDFLLEASRTRLAALWTLAVDSGMRQGELLGLHWPEVNLDRGTIHVKQALEEANGTGWRLKAPKTKKGNRVIRITPQTVASLIDHRQRMVDERRFVVDGPVFRPARRGEWIGKASIYKSFAKILVAAGLPIIRPYDLRHTCATLLLLKGVSIRVVADRLGHEDITTTLKHYAHVLPAMEEAAVEQMAAILGSATIVPR